MLSARYWLVPMVVATVLGSAPAHAETVRVTIDKLVFSPAVVKAKVGDTIEWVNNDILAHTATVKGDWDVLIHSHWNPSATDHLRFLEFIVAEKDKGRSIPEPIKK